MISAATGHRAALNFYEYTVALARDLARKQAAYDTVTDVNRAFQESGGPDSGVFLHTLEESGSKHGRLPAPLLNDIGYVYLLRFGEADMAVPYLREAIESDPDHINGWINLVFALVVLGRLAETQETLRAARARFPDEAWLEILQRPLPEGDGLPTSTHRCDTCPSEFSVESGFAICAGCATTFNDDAQCPMCLHHDAATSSCPVCRLGRISPVGTTGQPTS
ncbi:MAG: hypothetical protein QOE61_3866 [Micromonosporaceae bacterium]|jgi:tetratricopeptide (TPR) repeat protein|nr:hypothetical protein [Micromonosporaceae bacterium]